MAGVAEGFSLALSVLPIIISVAEHISDVSSVWSRYCNYDLEVQRHALALKTQRVVFKNDLVALLASCVGKAKAIDMFGALDHVAWKDSAIEDSLNERLGDDRVVFLELIQLIGEQLRNAEHKGLKYLEAVPGWQPSDLKGQNLGLKDSYVSPQKGVRSSAVVRKSQFALSKKDLQEDVRQLRSLINDFHILAEQTQKSFGIRPPERPSMLSQRDVEKFRQVQAVSQALYDAIGTACTVHSSHSVLLGLQPTVKESSLRVQFSMALRQSVMGTTLETPIWLNIESELEAPGIQHSLNNLPARCDTQQIGKRRNRSSSPQSLRHTPSNDRSCHIKDTMQTVQLESQQCAMEPPLRNLCRSKNFCTQLLKCVHSPLLASNYCLGFLEHPRRTKHLIYLNSNLHFSATKRASTTSTSLADLFDSFHRRGTRAASLPQFERLRFARMLATALLQFHATPWLTKAWCSKDVFFQGIDASSPNMISQFAEPFISVLIQATQRSLAQDRECSRTSQHSDKLGTVLKSSTESAMTGSEVPRSSSSRSVRNATIRNSMLYGLGVMLLELAFEAPIQALPTPLALRRGRTAAPHSQQIEEYEKAKNLCLGAPSTLGPQFSKIIRKCLDCDFARGTDLNDPALQEGVYREVICELKSLEDSFRALQIAT